MKKQLILSLALCAFLIFTACNNEQEKQNSKTINNEIDMKNFNAEAKTEGTPITSENVIDVLEIQRITNALTNGCDSQQWDVIRHILVDSVHTTIGEEKGKSSIKSKEEIVKRWKGFYDSVDDLIIHHVTSNERVFFHDSDNATVFSKGVIVVDNFLSGEDKLRMHRWINYEFGVTRTNNGWKVNKVLVFYLVEEASKVKK